MKNKLKKYAVALASCFGFGSVFAEGGTDFSSNAVTVGTDLASAFTTMATNISPVLKTVFIAALGIWVLYVLIGLIKKAWTRISGR